VLSKRPVRRSTWGVFPKEDPSDDEFGVQKRNNVEREGESGKLERELPFVVCVYSDIISS